MTKSKRTRKSEATQVATTETAATAVNETPSATTGQNVVAAAQSTVGRLRRFATEHPGTTLLAAAGASALIGAEFAAGALIGVGAALLTRKSTAELKDEIEQWGRQARALGARWGEKLHPKQVSQAS